MKRIPILLLLLAIAATAQAQVPALINYQGRLVDGTDLVNEPVSLELRLFDAATDGNLLYSDSNTVTVVDGLYSTHVGDDTIFGSLADALTNAMVYLEPVVNGAALSPRERLVTVPYAAVAETVRGADLHVDPTSGNVGIGTNNPSTNLHVNGSVRITDGSQADGRVLTSDADGLASWQPSASAPDTRVAYAFPNKVVVTNTSWTIIGYMAWDNSRYSGYSEGALVYEAVIVDRDLDIRVRDMTSSATIVLDGWVSLSGFRTAMSGFSNPSSDARLTLQARKSASGGTSPIIYGAQLEWTP